MNYDWIIRFVFIPSVIWVFSGILLVFVVWYFIVAWLEVRGIDLLEFGDEACSGTEDES